MNFEQWNEYHQNQAEKDVAKALKLFDEVLKMVALYFTLETVKKGLFSFELYPVLNKKINALFDRFNHSFTHRTNYYIDKHYNISKNKFKDIFSEATNKDRATLQNIILTEKKRLLSDRVWNLTKQYRTEIEMALDLAISDGTPAHQVATTLKKYLNNPNDLFRRYRDKNGVLQLSQKAKEYRSGQGVYRSAYKNAERLVRTEVNIAYRTADIERWQAMDSVAGYEIKRSKHPHGCEICDMMKGIYPKSFVWVGNHPNCRCYMIPIFKSDLKGKGLTINHELTQWIANNEDRITNAKSMPMFLWGVDSQSKGVSQKVIQAIQPFSRNTYVSFEPFSPVIVEHLKKIKHNADKQKLLQEIIDDNRAKTIFHNEINGAKTVMFDLHKGKGENLKNTLAMAKALNDKGKSVALLPEYDNVSSADAIVDFKNKLVVADFKHSTTKKIGTLKADIEKGFLQADNVVLQLEKGNTDLFIQSIEELKRKNKKLGNMILINKNNDILEISYKDFNVGKHRKLVRGFF
ncbi:hypothetical protein RCZ04_04350 [Capnocytophaga sp. HP1101]